MVRSKFTLAVALVLALAFAAFACGGKCENKTKTASNENATTKTMIAGGEKCPVQSAEKKDGKCDMGSCTGDMKHASSEHSTHTMTASGESAIKTANETKSDETMVDGNIYTLADGSKRFLCPVMQAQGFVKDSPEYSDYNGKRYYHCCAGCKDKFAGNPSKYLDALVIPANITKVEGKKMTFLCPVTKEEGIVGKDTQYVDTDGKRYYMCCPDCKAPFTKNPKKFSI